MATKSLGTVFSFNNVTIGKLRSISEITCDSEMIDITTLDEASGCRRFMQGAKDAGEVRLTGFHERDNEGQSILRAAYQSGEEGKASITFADGMQASFPALVKSHALGAAQVDGAIGFTCVLRVSGAITIL